MHTGLKKFQEPLSAYGDDVIITSQYCQNGKLFVTTPSLSKAESAPYMDSAYLGSIRAKKPRNRIL